MTSEHLNCKTKSPLFTVIPTDILWKISDFCDFMTIFALSLVNRYSCHTFTLATNIDGNNTTQNMDPKKNETLVKRFLMREYYLHLNKSQIEQLPFNKLHSEIIQLLNESQFQQTFQSLSQNSKLNTCTVIFFYFFLIFIQSLTPGY